MAEARVMELAGLLLEDRERRFCRALDGLGIPHNGPQSVELHGDECLYCIPDPLLTREEVSGLLSAFAREGVDYDLTLVADRWTGEDYAHQWPEDKDYGPGLAYECDPGTWPEGRYRLHLWLDESVWVAEADVEEHLAEDPDWSPIA